MSSIFGNLFQISTFGESHGKAVGVIIDGCPAGLNLCCEDIQRDLDRRKPGQSAYSTPRSEGDKCEILSGTFQGKTTGTPITIIVKNEDQKSRDYSDIANVFRPGHADYTYYMKYGLRDYRGGGRSSGRETVARVAAGAVARKILKEFNMEIKAYTVSVGDVEISREMMDIDTRFDNPLLMPDEEAYKKASKLVEEAMINCDSIGGVAECLVTGLIPGLGEPVFGKIDGEISKAIMSIGGIKGIEFGEGFNSSKLKGSENNDSFTNINGELYKDQNNSGGILGGITDGSNICFRAAFKPTPSIGQKQNTIDTSLENVEMCIKGRHDPIIVPRGIVVIEAMTALVLVDMLLINAKSQMSNLKKIYN